MLRLNRRRRVGAVRPVNATDFAASLRIKKWAAVNLQEPQGSQQE